MDFAYPKILYAFILIPIFSGLYMLSQHARKRKIKKFGHQDVLKPLMPEASKYKAGIKITLELIAFSALIIALARPRGGQREQNEESRGIEVMICMDVSRSMLASASDDPNGVSRLNRAKFLLDKLINKLNKDKVGLIVFAGYPYTQIPLTNDFGYARGLINELTPESVQTQGTDIGAAIAMALNNFSPAEDVNKAIVIITDTEDHEAQATVMANRAKNEGVQVNVIGIGTPKGAPIPVNPSRSEYFKDYDGNVVMTALNPEAGKQIAEAGSGIYINGSASDAVSQIDDQLEAIEKSDLGKVSYKASAEKFPIFIWIALIALCIDIFILERKIGWLQKINFFSRSEK